MIVAVSDNKYIITMNFRSKYNKYYYEVKAMSVVKIQELPNSRDKTFWWRRVGTTPQDHNIQGHAANTALGSLSFPCTLSSFPQASYQERRNIVIFREARVIQICDISASLSVSRQTKTEVGP